MTLFEAHSTVKVNPARAGMIPQGGGAQPSRSGKPRASGDDPALGGVDRLFTE